MCAIVSGSTFLYSPLVYYAFVYSQLVSGSGFRFVSATGAHHHHRREADAFPSIGFSLTSLSLFHRSSAAAVSVRRRRRVCVCVPVASAWHPPAADRAMHPALIDSESSDGCSHAVPIVLPGIVGVESSRIAINW